MNLEKEFPFHFNLPQYIKDFLHELSQTPTFKTLHEKELTSLNDETKTFVEKNRWLLFEYHLPYDSIFQNEDGTYNTIRFGYVGRYQYDSIKAVELIFGTQSAYLITGYCYSSYCQNPRSTQHNIPKHSTSLVTKLFNNYKKEVTPNGTI